MLITKPYTGIPTIVKIRTIAPTGQKALWTPDYARMKSATERQHIKEAGTAAKVPQIHLGHANIQHADLYSPA